MKTAPEMRDAIVAFLLVVFSTRYASSPEIGQHPFHQFLVFSSLKADGGFTNVRSFGPRLAGSEFVIRAVVMDSVLSLLGEGPARELSSDAEGAFKSDTG